MFDRFTERARKVMTLARQQALNLRNDYIGPEHVLLGLVEEGGGVAAQVLKNLHVDLQKVRAEVERLVGRGTNPVLEPQLPFTPRAKRVLEVALEESQNLGHNYIGTEHLLLGLIREKDGPAALVLQILGVKPEDVREEVVDLVGSGPMPPPPSPPPAGGLGFLVSYRGSRQLGFGTVDGFTLQAAEVLERTETVARAFRNDYLGVEHLLIALSGGEGVAAWVLRQAGLEPKRIEEETNRVVEQGEKESPPGLLPLTPRLQRILVSARKDSAVHGLGYVGTEDILDALVLETVGPAADVLRNLGVTLGRIREEIRALRETEPGSAGAPSEVAPTSLPDHPAREEARARVEAVLTKRLLDSPRASVRPHEIDLEVHLTDDHKGPGFQLWLGRVRPDRSLGIEIALWAKEASHLEEAFDGLLEEFVRLVEIEERGAAGGTGDSIKK